MNANGTNQANITNDNLTDDSRRPGLRTSIGSRTADSTFRDGEHRDLRHERRRKRPTDLSNDPAEASWPTWSPDGTPIAFGSDATVRRRPLHPRPSRHRHRPLHRHRPTTATAPTTAAAPTTATAPTTAAATSTAPLPRPRVLGCASGLRRRRSGGPCSFGQIRRVRSRRSLRGDVSTNAEAGHDQAQELPGQARGRPRIEDLRLSSRPYAAIDSPASTS